MAKKEVITLDADGAINTEMHGFQGKSCLKAAADIARELERLGVVTEVADLHMKDTTEVAEAAQKTALKVERR